MPTYYDSQNKARVLTERIGSGGEGTVFFCGEDFSTVAKIYHAPVTVEKAVKLRWMAANKNERLLKTAAWVVDVLTDAPGGSVVGFLMPSVKAKEIHELYSLKSRRVYFPEATWHFLVHTAANVARAFYNLHRAGHVMGDVNHGNCVVLADGTVKLIDCDSYSIKTDERRYPCEVGVATHLAPELQGVNLSRIERLERHDNFGLAVIIFQLLFLGRHPFAGNYLGGEDKSIEDCIREFRFAYGDNAAIKNVKQPPGTLPLAAVSTRVALMFERAFLTEDRPEPREWIEALADLSNSLEQCAVHPGHLYYEKLAACPWCEIERQTGLMLFPFVTTGNHPGGEKPFNIFTVENLIANLGISNALPAKPPAPVAALPPSAEVVEAKRENRNVTIISLTVQFIGLIFFMTVLGVGIAAFFGMLGLIFWLVYTNNSVKYLREELEENLSDAQRQWETVENEWKLNALPPKLGDDLTKIRKKVGDYQKFQQTSARRVKLLRDNQTRRRLYEHLRSARLAEAKIYGIREKQLENLLGNGFETAAEMDSGRLRSVPEIGKRTIEKLLEWRRDVENSFAAEPLAGDLKEEQTKLVAEAAGERRRIEREIEQLLVSLRSGAVNLRRRRQQLSAQATELAERLAQTKSNAEYLGTNSAAIVGLILITFLLPYFGFIVEQVNERQQTFSSKSGSGYGTSDGVYQAPLSKTVTTDYPKKLQLKVPDENITDAEIAALSKEQRAAYTDNLFSLANEAIYAENPDYADAERKTRLALRLEADVPHLLTQLGNVLYRQDKYKESLKYLNRSLKIDPKNSATKIYIGINYLRLNRFKEARAILTEVVNENSSSFEGNYNLGLAHIGLKNYDSAVDVLQKATVVSKDDPDAHYQLGFCFYKLGRDDEAYGEYLTLIELDEAMAERFNEATDIARRIKIVQAK